MPLRPATGCSSTRSISAAFGRNSGSEASRPTTGTMTVPRTRVWKVPRVPSTSTSPGCARPPGNEISPACRDRVPVRSVNTMRGSPLVTTGTRTAATRSLGRSGNAPSGSRTLPRRFRISSAEYIATIVAGAVWPRARGREGARGTGGRVRHRRRRDRLGRDRRAGRGRHERGDGRTRGLRRRVRELRVRPEQGDAEGRPRRRARPRAGEFGIRVGPVEVDFPAVMRRVRALIDEETREGASVYEQLGARVLMQEARLTGPHRVETADGTAWEADRVVLATGSAASAPPIEGLARGGYWTNREAIWHGEAVPASLAILGAGAIGVEFAQI